MTTPHTVAPAARTYEVKTYGCQMNVNDSEVMLSVLKDRGYGYSINMRLVLLEVLGLSKGIIESFKSLSSAAWYCSVLLLCILLINLTAMAACKGILLFV